jgi:hypothetical protein
VRARLSQIDLNPVLPPYTTAVRFVNMHYAGAKFSLAFNASNMHVVLAVAPTNSSVWITIAGTKQSAQLVPNKAFLHSRAAFSLSTRH